MTAKIFYTTKHIGLLDEAMVECQKALEINPGNLIAQYRIGIILFYQGNFAQALSVSEKLQDDDIAEILFCLDRKQEALVRANQFAEKRPNYSNAIAFQALMFAAFDENRKAEEKIAVAIEKGKNFSHFHHTEYYIGAAYALMKNNRLAIQWLRKAAEDGFPCYPWFKRDPTLDNLRNDPEFIAFLEQLKKQWEYYKSIL